MNEFMIKKDDLFKTRDAFLEHFFISALTSAVKDGNLEPFLKEIDWHNKKEIECYMVVEGKKIPIDKVCEEWEAQVDRMIYEKALELLKDKLGFINDVAYDIVKEMTTLAEKKLGIKLSDYGE